MEKQHFRSKSLRLLLIIATAIAILWTALTVWVEMPGKDEVVALGDPADSIRVLIVYDPDPIYNLDEQVCRGIAEGLNDNHIQAFVATVKAAMKLDLRAYGSLVICANTYNWAPDKAVVNFIENSSRIGNMRVVAVTVGSGSTSEAREKLEGKLRAAGANIIISKEWWLMRPNDESRLKEKNVDVAVDQAFHTGLALSDSLRVSSF